MVRAILLSLTVVAILPGLSRADGLGKHRLALMNQWLAGQVVDYTCNHGADRRLFSEALQCPRDLYVYLPPGFDPHCRYPLMIYLHGYHQDEKSFLENVIWHIDQAIEAGKLPPLIVAAPDGTLTGEPQLHEVGSFYLNSCAGKFQDWITIDVWNFMMGHYPIRPEREAHVLAGASMGAFGAYNIGMKNCDRFKIIIGIMPAINLRWVDCHGIYEADFDPCCWGWRTVPAHPKDVVGSFCLGLIKVRSGEIMDPVFGPGEEGLRRASEENPIEMIDRFKICAGSLDMFVAYAGCDEFNLDAQAESFVYFAKSRGIRPYVFCDPLGKHDSLSARKMIPPAIHWLNERLRGYSVCEPVKFGPAP